MSATDVDGDESSRTDICLAASSRTELDDDDIVVVVLGARRSRHKDIFLAVDVVVVGARRS